MMRTMLHWITMPTSSYATTRSVRGGTPCYLNMQLATAEQESVKGVCQDKDVEIFNLPEWFAAEQRSAAATMNVLQEEARTADLAELQEKREAHSATFSHGIAP